MEALRKHEMAVRIDIGYKKPADHYINHRGELRDEFGRLKVLPKELLDELRAVLDRATAHYNAANGYENSGGK